MQSGHDRASDRPRGPAHRTSRTCLVSPSPLAPSPLEQRHRRRTVRHRRWQTRVAVLSRHPGSVTGRAERPRSSLRPAAWSRPPHLAYVPCLAVAVGAAAPLEQRHRRRTVRHRRWQTRVAVLSRHPGSVTGRAERPRSSLRPAAWSRPPHLAYVPCLAVAVGTVAVGAAPSPSDGAPSPLADASSRPLSPPPERHGPCRAATIEPPTGRVVPPTAPRVRALSRRRRWSSAVAVGAAPSPSDGVPSPLADASSRPLSPSRERHGPCRAAAIEPPTGRVVPPTAPRVRAVGAAPSPLEQRHRRRTGRHRRWQTRVAVLSRHPGSVTGRAERPRSSLRPAAWSRPPHLAYVPCLAVAVGAAPSPSDGAPSPLS